MGNDACQTLKEPAIAGMDVHRCRFVPYPPSAINALAFSHQSSFEGTRKSPQSLRLAIGRANGDIEIWNPQQGHWFQESIIRGGKDRSIEGLVWTQDPEELDKDQNRVSGKLRLFSIGYSTAVTEWDLTNGKPVRHCTANYGEIWCMTAQPRFQESPNRHELNGVAKEQDLSLQCQNIAVGCADGAIVLMSTANENLQFLRTLTTSASSKARVLSIAYQNHFTVVTGHADSTIRVFDVKSRQLLRSMSLGAGPAGGPKETLVWSVKCACDGMIVSGDSTGTVRFWDGRTYTLSQRIKGHVADVLDIAISADGRSVFSGSMDRRTTLYRRMATTKKGESSRWKEIVHQRLHKHDVKALAPFESRNMSIVVSGGLDTKPIVTPIKEFGRENHRALSALPQQPPMCSVPSKRLLLSWWHREISVWSIPNSPESTNTFEADENIIGETKTKLTAKIELQGEESITCVDISADGQLIAVATISHIKVFRLRFRNGPTIKVGKFDLPPTMSNSGAKTIRFSPDGRWLLIIRLGSTVELHRLTQIEGKSDVPKISNKSVLLRRMKRSQADIENVQGTHASYNRSISRTAFSADSRILVVGDLSGYIDTWVLEGNEDLTQVDAIANGASDSETSGDEDSDSDEEQHPLVIYGQHWIRNPAAPLIPKLDATPLVLAFRPSLTSSISFNENQIVHPTRHTPHPHSHVLPNGEDRLFVVTSENRIHEFAVLTGRLTEWSRRNPIACFPAKFRDHLERTMGVLWDIRKTKERVWLYGSSWLWMFDLTQDLSDHLDSENYLPQGNEDQKPRVNGAKRKREADEGKPRTEASNSRNRSTGAGSQIQDSMLTSGIGRNQRKIEGIETTNGRLINLGQELSQDSDGEEEDQIASSALIELRRKNRALLHQGKDEVVDGKDPVQENGVVIRDAVTSNPRCWFTHNYRSILGIVPIGDERGPGNDSQGQRGVGNEGDQELEVALVERPVEEVDLPARFHGDQEYQ